MAAMPRPARVVTWNGKDVHPELRELPAGRYVVEAVEEEAPALSPDAVVWSWGRAAVPDLLPASS